MPVVSVGPSDPTPLFRPAFDVGPVPHHRSLEPDEGRREVLLTLPELVHPPDAREAQPLGDLLGSDELLGIHLAPHLPDGTRAAYAGRGVLAPTWAHRYVPHVRLDGRIGHTNKPRRCVNSPGRWSDRDLLKARSDVDHHPNPARPDVGRGDSLEDRIVEAVRHGVDKALEPYLRRLTDPECLTLTIPQTATVIGTSPATVRKLVADGHLPTVPHMGERRLIPRAAVERFVDGAAA